MLRRVNVVWYIVYTVRLKRATSEQRSTSTIMDPEAFLDMANQVIKLKMFPYFDIAHCVLVAAHVRDDLGTGELRRSALRPRF